MATGKQKKELLAAYLLVGEDSLKRSRTLVKLRERLKKLGDLTFNSDDLDGEIVLGEDVVTACNTVPFASEKRLVHVRNADKLKKTDSEAIISYLKSPCETTVLLLEAEKLAKNTRLYKAIAAIDSEAIIDCAPPAAKELPTTVRSFAVGCGVTFTDAAARKLIEFVGEDMVRLDSEVRKIALAHRGSAAVSEAEVASMVAHTSEVKWWSFVDAFAARDLPKSLALLGEMKKTSPFFLLPKCIIRIRELICVQTMARRGNPAAAAKELKFPDWKMKNYKIWARMFSPEELRGALSSARDAELRMKSGADADEAFRDWVVDTLRKG